MDVRRRRRFRVTGTVQGVGFRPFVYRRAVELGLSGFVLNDSEGVLIEVEGDGHGIDELARALRDDAPPLARVDAVRAEDVEPRHDGPAFVIEHSEDGGAPDVPISIDVAPCAECLAEVFDPGDRRHRYPFTNCTNCGPRYTIVRSVPYDRPSTTMAEFVMCPACQAEYDDPADRRFHAQPNACPVCGPHVTWRDSAGTALADGDAAVEAAVAALLAGAIVAVKGVGGYHLAADATSDEAVGELRRRKARDDKPFAVMVADLGAARALADLDDAGAEAISSPRRPIVLAPRTRDCGDRRCRRTVRARARADVALQPAPPPAAGGRWTAARHDERKRQRRADRARRRRCSGPARADGGRIADARPADPHPVRRLGRPGSAASGCS